MKSNCFNVMSLVITDHEPTPHRFRAWCLQREEIMLRPSKFIAARKFTLGDEPCLNSVLAIDYFRRTNN